MKLWRYALQHSASFRDTFTLIHNVRDHDFSSVCEPHEMSLTINGKRMIFSLRKGTTDTVTFVEVFRDACYGLPSGFQPEVIVDIGGNIGLATLYFSNLFPEAKIHVFEPIPANYQMICRQIENNRLKNITPHPFGLGASNHQVTLRAPSCGAFGCFSATNQQFGQDSVQLTVQIRAANEVFDELKLSKIDLAKVDCEGAELEVFRSIDGRLKDIEVLLGELHMDATNVFEVMHLLKQSHHVDFEKKMGWLKNYPFRASLKPWDQYR